MKLSEQATAGSDAVGQLAARWASENPRVRGAERAGAPLIAGRRHPRFASCRPLPDRDHESGGIAEVGPRRSRDRLLRHGTRRLAARARQRRGRGGGEGAGGHLHAPRRRPRARVRLGRSRHPTRAVRREGALHLERHRSVPACPAPRGATTGRPKILKLAGHFHGWHDQVSYGTDPPFRGPERPACRPACKATSSWRRPMGMQCGRYWRKATLPRSSSSRRELPGERCLCRRPSSKRSVARRSRWARC